MKQTKKGFTLVELLVVIAILAVLATVSIVGYLSFINKANISVDEHAVTQFNIVLEGEEILGNVPESIQDIKTILATHGYNQQLIPITAGHRFYWHKADNVIVLVDSDNKVIFPKEHAGEDINVDRDYIDLSNLPSAIIDVQTNVDFEAGSDTINIDHVLMFTAKDSPEQAAQSDYADWNCDFRISFSQDLDAENTTYLIGGYYASYGASVILDQDQLKDVLNDRDGADQMECVEAGSYLLLGTMSDAYGIDFAFSYETICTEVGEFLCGFDVQGSHPGLVVTVELIIYDPEVGYENSCIVLATYEATY